MTQGPIHYEIKGKRKNVSNFLSYAPYSIIWILKWC